MCHSILFQYILKILVNVIRFLQYFLQICYKSQCPLPSALLYLRGPSSVGKAEIFLLNAPYQVPYFTRGARPVLQIVECTAFSFKSCPLPRAHGSLPRRAVSFAATSSCPECQIKLNLMGPLIMLYHIELFEYTLITILFTIYLTFGIGMAKFLGFQKIKLD